MTTAFCCDSVASESDSHYISRPSVLGHGKAGFDKMLVHVVVISFRAGDRR